MPAPRQLPSRSLPSRRGTAVTAAVALLALLVGVPGLLAPAPAGAAVMPPVRTTPQPAPMQPAPMQAGGSTSTRLVSTDPSDTTPMALDGEVTALAQVGTRVVVGGTFTMIRSAADPTPVAQARLFAYDRATGVLDTGFRPVLDGAVGTLAASPDGRSVYVGGSFTSVNGRVNRYLTRLDTTTGAVVPGFAPAMNGRVSDVEVAGSALYVTGWFTSAGGTARTGLARLVAATGGGTGLTLDLATTRAASGVRSLEVTPDGTRLVLAGNFTSVGGVARDQVAVVDLSTPAPTVRADWRTTSLEFSRPERTRAGIATYVRDLALSSDGSFFVVGTTFYYPGNGDSVTRFATRAVGTDVPPTWIRYTGTDTVTAVTISPDDRIVYLGGHFRWYATSQVGALPGRVARYGLAAADATTGMALDWAPTRDRAYGVLAMLVDSAGDLVVGHDSRTVAGETHQRLASFPAATGRTISPAASPATPVTVSRVGAAGQVTTTTWSGTAVTGTASAGWTLPGLRAATPVGTELLGATATAFLRYEGDAEGRWVVRDRVHLPGVVPSAVTGLAFVGEHVLYTLAGQPGLYGRAMSSDSWLVAPTAVTVSGPGVDTRTWSDTTSLFVADGVLFQAGAGGVLRRVGLAPRTGAPAAVTTVATASGPATDGRSWAGVLVGAGAPVPATWRPNWALGAGVTAGPTTSGELGRVTDGDRDGTAQTVASVTAGATGTWVDVDLGTPRPITGVRLWSRSDDGAAAMTPTVAVSDSPIVAASLTELRALPRVTEADVHGLPSAGLELAFDRTGRYVRVMVPSFEGLGLQLAEVEVLGPAGTRPAPADGEDVALGQPAVLSPAADRAQDAGNAVDGRAETSVARTGAVAGAWLQVDLGRLVPVAQVRLTAAPGEHGRLDTARVLLSASPFTSTDATASTAQPGVVTLDAVGVPTLVLPAGASARYVRVQQRAADALALTGLSVVAGAGPAQPVAAEPVAGLGVPAVWLDAADASTVLVSGGSVTAWLDRSGHRRSFVASGPGTTYAASALAGRPAVVTGGASVLATGHAFGPASTVVVVARQTGTTNGRVLSGVRTDWTAGWADGREGVARLGGVLARRGVAATTTPHVVTVTAGDGRGTLRQDGVPLASVPGAYLSPDGLQVGGGCCGTGVGGAGSTAAVAEVIVYDRVLTVDEQASVERYLAGRWGLRLSAPRPAAGVAAADRGGRTPAP